MKEKIVLKKMKEIFNTSNKEEGIKIINFHSKNYTNSKANKKNSAEIWKLNMAKPCTLKFR